MSRFSGTVLAALFALGAAVASPGGDKQKADREAVEKELQRLQGTWEQVSVEANGQKEGFARGLAPLFTIRGDTYAVEVGGRILERGRVKVYPAGNPRQSDLIAQDGTARAKIYPAIHEIKGDELRTCFSRNGGNRPTAFTSGAEGGYTVNVYRRVSPKK